MSRYTFKRSNLRDRILAVIRRRGLFHRSPVGIPFPRYCIKHGNYDLLIFSSFLDFLISGTCFFNVGRFCNFWKFLSHDPDDVKSFSTWLSAMFAFSSLSSETTISSVTLNKHSKQIRKLNEHYRYAFVTFNMPYVLFFILYVPVLF